MLAWFFFFFKFNPEYHSKQKHAVVNLEVLRAFSGMSDRITFGVILVILTPDRYRMCQMVPTVRLLLRAATTVLAFPFLHVFRLLMAASCKRLNEAVNMNLS